jgi:dienelactone hydrolase
MQCILLLHLRLLFSFFMTAIKNIVLPGRHGRPILTDIFFEESGRAKPVLIYAHGFNGFKDWGAFDLLAEQAAEAGFVFIKFNFAFNGTTPEEPEVFADLDAYAENNYTKELDDLDTVIDWALGKQPYSAEMDASRIGLIGHSRGGGIVLIAAAEDPRIKAVATWASVSACKTPWGSWPEERMKEWRETGVQFILNSRTQQQMPVHYQLYEDYVQHNARLDVRAAIARLDIPVLICHGTEDTSVPLSSAYALQHAQPASALFTVPSDHVFGRKHPWTEPQSPLPMQRVMDRTLMFFRESFRQDG